MWRAGCKTLPGSVLSGENVKRPQRSANGRPGFLSADALLNLSSHQYTAKKYDAAEANLKMALHLWEAKEGRRCFGVSTCLNNLGRICEERGETRQGVLYHQEAVSIRKEILGIHPETAFSLGNYGAALAGDAQWEKAANTLEEALTCYDSLGLSDSPEAVTCRNNLNLCRNAAKQSAAQ